MIIINNEKIQSNFSYISALKFLNKYLRKYRCNLFIFYLGCLVTFLIDLINLIIFGKMVNSIVYRMSFNLFLKFSIFFLSFCILKSILVFITYHQHQLLMKKYVVDIKNDIVEVFVDAKPISLCELSSGDIINILHTYPIECLNFIIRNVVHRLNRRMFLIIYIIIIFIINIKIGFIFLLITPFYIITNIYFGYKIKLKANDNFLKGNSFTVWLVDILSGIRDLKLLNATKIVNKQFTDNFRELMKARIDTNLLNLNSINIINFFNNFLHIAILIISTFLIKFNNIDVGIILILFSLTSKIQYLITQNSSEYLESKERIIYIEKIKDFLNKEIESEEPLKKGLLIKKGEISFNNIYYSFENRKTIFNNLSLKINAGEKIAIVGKSGIGKTTLINLLIGLFDLDSGSIHIDGQDISKYSFYSIRNCIGIVSQDVLLFNDTIENNISLGEECSTNEEIEEACKNAGILHFINSLPEKFNTVIGSNNINLSGGQKQRIEIARIYLKNPPIIIFDEATSAIDDKTERKIYRLLYDIMKNKTSIIITHKISSIKMCDKVAILENGKIDNVYKSNEFFKETEKVKQIFNY